MPTTQFPKIPGPPNKPDLQSLAAYVGQLANLLAVLSKELDYLLNGSLDVRNIRSHSITAETLNVDELSAITANLGTITAGIINGIQIYGSYIATANGSFPRVELSSTGNLLRAYLDADNYVEFVPLYSGAPGINFVSGGTIRGQMRVVSGNLRITGTSGFVLETASGDIELIPASLPTPGSVKVSSWTSIKENSGATLQDALNDKADVTALSSKATAGASTGSAGGGSFNGGFPVGKTFQATDGTTWAWQGINISSHSHTQT